MIIIQEWCDTVFESLVNLLAVSVSGRREFGPRPPATSGSAAPVSNTVSHHSCIIIIIIIIIIIHIHAQVR